jgi:hypothetical protein
MDVARGAGTFILLRMRAGRIGYRHRVSIKLRRGVWITQIPTIPPPSCRFYIKEFLEPRENLPYFFRLAQIGDGIGNGIMVFEVEQWYYFFLIEFPHTLAHIVVKYKIEEYGY